MSTKEKENGVVSTIQNSSHFAAAQERVQELRRMREVIPGFAVPASARETRRLHSAASVPPEFVELTTVAKLHEAALVRGESLTPAETRDLMSYGEAYRPLADELEALAQFVRHSIAAACNAAGSEALTTYALAQRLARQPKTAGLAPFVTDMRRALGRTRKPAPATPEKKGAKTAATGATQQPTQPSTQQS